jgi:hypothetical protein
MLELAQIMTWLYYFLASLTCYAIEQRLVTADCASIGKSEQAGAIFAMENG